MHEGTSTVETCHAYFLKISCQQKRAFSYKTLAYHGLDSPHDPPYHGHLLFKEFGLMVDSNTINTAGKTSIDIHGLGAERGNETHIDGKKMKCNGTKAPFHMVIDQETAQYLDCGNSQVFATGINDCFSPTKCKRHLEGRLKRSYLIGLKLSNYVPEMVSKRGCACLEEKHKSWNIEIVTI